MHYDPDRSWIADPDLDHPKGTQPESRIELAICLQNTIYFKINVMFILTIYVLLPLRTSIANQGYPFKQSLEQIYKSGYKRME